MDIKQLRYFVAIVEEGQITAAAKRLHMTQPPLSQQLSIMEEELGTRLFHKVGKRLELTDAGEALYRNAINIVNLMEESNKEVKEIGKGDRGKLLIGVNTLSHYKLSSVLRRFQERHPEVSYKVQQNESGQLCKLLKEREIELAIVRFPVDLKNFSAFYFKEDPFYFVTSNKLALQGNKVSYEDIKEFPLILPSTDGLGLYNMILEQFSSRELEANVICECSDILVLLELVSESFGGTIIPESVLKIHKGYNLKKYKIDDDAFTSSSGVIWLKDRYLSMASRNFIKLLREIHEA
ncbi:LysR family transcriptional regulator [Clostridium cylindrosporum]|uniref:HTH-type transcriptional regulator BsdA n=1 Tax=Clostridium cylindrosporum DSM 605 TaxID=1121307 RepID=A0A0J8D7U8_CLOCY|nr:LysR family transcriptional regulator [Clostridium cylindrosporum]KMT21957.1 HTH-type transcriptional regulator BsdA [Clostridium cylindrosporum DSM 605]